MEETEISTETETRAQRLARRAAEKKAEQERELEVPFARRHALMLKDRDNAEMMMVDNAAALRKKRIAELVADKKKQNYYRWIAALHRQKKWKERTNGRIV